MQQVEKLSIALTAEHAELVRKAVQSGAYASCSEVIRHGLRLLSQEMERKQATLEELRLAVREGLASGSAGAFDLQGFLADVRQESKLG